MIIVPVLPLLSSTPYLLAGSFLLACSHSLLFHICRVFHPLPLFLLTHSYMVGPDPIFLEGEVMFKKNL